ncbi:MAG: hypothetical protein HPY66_1432 [Firmicutes bacterium]|nr:hypothetical protein [Bacillota bacterium]MDI6706455.1 XRE family transcriptional regulator [Bacillota bacterium]
MLGNKIREVRLGKNLKLSELADKTGLSTSYISLLERDLTSPSISSLRKIAEALEVPLFHFLIEENKSSIITRKDERKKLALPQSNIVYEYVTPIPTGNQVKPKLEIIYTELEPDAWSSDEPMSHKADECLLVLGGEIEVHVGAEVYVLKEGDSLYIEEMIPHRFCTLSREKAKLISAMVPAIF